MKKIHLFIWIVIFGGQLSAQTIEDLLYKVENQTGKAKIETLFEVGQIYLKKEPQKAVFYLEKALTEAKNLNDTQILISAYFKLAEATQEQYNYAIQYEAKEGELISDICKRFGVTRKELAKNNYLPEDKEVIASYRNTFEINSSLSFIQPLAFKQVCEYYEKALKLRRTQKNNDYLIFTLKKAGDFYTKEQQFDKTEKHYLEWLKIRRTQKDTTKLVWVLRHLADFYRESEQNIQAKKFYDEIIAIDKIRKNRNDFANTLAEISLIYPDHIQAEKYFHQALKFWIAEKNQTKIEWMRNREYYSEEGGYFGKGQEKEEEKYLLERLKMTKISMDTILVYNAYKRLVYFYMRDRSYAYHQAKYYLDSLWNFALERKSFVKSLAWKGNIMESIANYAIRYFPDEEPFYQFTVDYLYIFKDYFEKYKPEKWELQTVYTKLDYFYRKIERYDSSAYFFKKSLNHSILSQKRWHEKNYPSQSFSDKDIYNYAEQLDDLAFLYQKANNYTDALLYFNKALDIQKTKQNPVWVSEQLNKIGYLYEQKLDVKKMNEYYQKALKNVQKIERKEVEENEKRSMDLTMQFWRIAQVYDKKGDGKKAVQFAQESVEISTTLDRLYFRRFISQDYEYPKTEKFREYLEKLKNKK